MYVLTVFLTFLVNIIICRDFYVGMFRSNDILVAQDRLYREKIYFRSVTAKYGRTFKCPITYFRVVDRLGVGRGPRVEIIRGGLRKKYLVLRITSVYNYPISVNIYVGCERKTEIVQPTKATTTTTTTEAVTKNTEAVENETTVGNGTSESDTTPSPANETVVDDATKNDTAVTNTTIDANETSTNTTR